ncbi:peptidoglycan DD-metalloendopeptidase family protein [uncultured Croceitalea sp.]|uniref:peptidoglycan DD-metalloendopeptidase family protein n=1 Tax=uncultured Croceitalea sp. TaxID=1798908 RepID=UPI00374EF4EA
MIFSSLTFDEAPRAILDYKLPLKSYTPIDLSVTNKELRNLDIANPHGCQEYIEKILKRNKAQVAYGGYLEKRNLYSSNRFSVGNQRNIHLGIDFWCKAGTVVHAPINGKVHSFKNNEDMGNYGPTIVLEHLMGVNSFYTLYGHLAIASLNDLYIGKQFKKGEILGALGTTDINVNYAPHLHFQIIEDIGNYRGDYPGVCNEKDLDFYKRNCPDPNLLFKL